MRDVEIIVDHLLKLDPQGATFDSQKVLVEAQTKRLFKAAMPTVVRAEPQTNTLHLSYGRDDGVIAGMAVSLTSRTGEFRQLYVLRDSDVRRDHLCIKPPGLALSSTPAHELIVSFVPPRDLNDYEQNVALLVDIATGTLDQCRDALNAES